MNPEDYFDEIYNEDDISSNYYDRYDEQGIFPNDYMLYNMEDMEKFLNESDDYSHTYIETNMNESFERSASGLADGQVFNSEIDHFFDMDQNSDKTCEDGNVFGFQNTDLKRLDLLSFDPEEELN